MSGERITLPAAVLAEIYLHAQQGYPEEVCGFILGRGDEAEVHRCDNRQNDLHREDPVTFSRDARTAYNLGPKDLLLLDKSFRSSRPVTILYHSHCDVGAYFSEEDKRAATPFGEPLYPIDYLVIDAQQNGIVGSKLFRWIDGDNDFVEVAGFGMR